MFKRTRDVKRRAKVYGKISYEEWQEVENRYAYAKGFMSKTNPLYLLLKEDLQNAKDIILENRIKEVREENQITEAFKKVFIFSKKVQTDELIGQYKYVKDLLDELQSWIDIKEEFEKQEADGKLIIERGERNEG